MLLIHFNRPTSFFFLFGATWSEIWFIFPTISSGFFRYFAAFQVFWFISQPAQEFYFMLLVQFLFRWFFVGLISNTFLRDYPIVFSNTLGYLRFTCVFFFWCLGNVMNFTRLSRYFVEWIRFIFKPFQDQQKIHCNPSIVFFFIIFNHFLPLEHLPIYHQKFLVSSRLFKNK